MRVLLLLALLYGCAPRVLEGAPMPEDTPSVHMTEATRDLLIDMHRRMSAHQTLPDHETLLCLLGHVEGHDVYVDAFAAAKLSDQTATGVTFGCPVRDDFIGTWHNHPTGPWGAGCWHSDQDVESFLAEKREILAIVTCEDHGEIRFLSKIKKGYSTRAGA